MAERTEFTARRAVSHAHLPGCRPLALFAAVLLAAGSFAQDTPLHKKVSVDYRGMVAADALKDLGDKAGVTFTIAADLLAGAALVTCKATDQEAGRVAMRILRPRGFTLALADGRPPAVTKYDALDEFKVKRETAYAFVAKPSVSLKGDNLTIAFETSAFCDCTVAIEDPSAGAGRGRIIRHLACGVLGENAPEPFLWNTKKQVLVWDGKNDRGEYVDNKDACLVRVSLGLKPAFERNLFLEPKRRHGREAPLFQVAPEGVYVYDGGNGIDFVKLYNHDGTYARTVYPFAADKIGQVKGLKRVVYPQDGATLPFKPTFLEQTFLTCGNLYGYQYPKEYALAAMQAGGDNHYGMYGNASSILAVNAGRLALGKTYLYRLATDGTSGGVDVEGPAIALPTMGKAYDTRGKTIAISPRGAALSPDGKTLYLTGYIFCHYSHASADIVGNGEWDAFHVVLKMNLDENKAPTLFAGNMEVGKSGTDNKSFHVPTSVAVDKEGRVYVADFMNNRVQVFAPDGSFLKTIPAARPAIVSIAAKTQDIYVFSSLIYYRELVQKQEKVATQLTVFGPFADPRKKSSCPLPGGFGGSGVGFWYGGLGTPLSAAVDDQTEPPTIWMANEWTRESVLTRGKINYGNITLFALDKEGLRPIDSFGKDVEKSVQRARPPAYGRARLYTNPRNGRVYVGEGEAFDNKSFKTMIELDPETGGIRVIGLPFDAEDMCFDNEGLAYLRNIGLVARYDSSTWREVPWDYGEEHKGVCTSSSSDRKQADTQAALPLPADGGWHHGGMFVSARGNLLVACGVNLEAATEKYETGEVAQPGKNYKPAMYPGRSVAGRGGAPLLHIWDVHGKTVFEDVCPGIAGNTYGLGLDHDDAVYMMHSAARTIAGKTYLDRLSGTAIKVIPGKPRFVAGKAPLPLPESDYPKRPADLVGIGLSPGWAEGAEWLYGGVGYDGKNAGVGCGCWNARMAFDYFARTFAPELQRGQIAVLDAAGNLILRLGRYGNADDGVPTVRNAERGMPGVRNAERGIRSGEEREVMTVKDTPDSALRTPRSALETPNSALGIPHSIGGDEVAMTHGAYLATLTDRRLFVADPANDRIFSVRLGYHTEEKVALKSVVDVEKK